MNPVKECFSMLMFTVSVGGSEVFLVLSNIYSTAVILLVQFHEGDLLASLFVVGANLSGIHQF